MGRDLAHLHPELRRRLVALMEASGTYLVSGYRSQAEQAALYEGWINRRPGYAPANPPCRSNHEAEPCGGVVGGLAADIGGDKALARSLAPEFGLHFNIASEDWHVQCTETTSGSWQGWGDLGPPGEQRPVRYTEEPDMRFRYDVGPNRYVNDNGRIYRVPDPGYDAWLAAMRVKPVGGDIEVEVYPMLSVNFGSQVPEPIHAMWLQAGGGERAIRKAMAALAPPPGATS